MVETVEALEWALRLKPGQLEASVNLGQALRDLGRLGDAMDALASRCLSEGKVDIETLILNYFWGQSVGEMEKAKPQP